MVKNNKGFSLIELLAVIIIIGIVALIAIPSVSEYIQKASDTSYESYERSMKDAAKSRIIECETNPSANCNLRLPYKVYKECDTINNPDSCETSAYRIPIYLNTLVTEGFIDNMKDPESNETCSDAYSYVLVTLNKKDTAEYDYEACLQCGDYKTVSGNCWKIGG